MAFKVGERVIYRKRGQIWNAVIKKVHDEVDPPFYTIGVDGSNGGEEREVQTEAENLQQQDEEDEEDFCDCRQCDCDRKIAGLTERVDRLEDMLEEALLNNRNADKRLESAPLKTDKVDVGSMRRHLFGRR